MTASGTVRMKPYIQPFERLLAMQELDALFDLDAHSANGLLTVAASSDKAGRLAYWETVGENYTPQVQREAASIIARNGIALNEVPFISSGQISLKIPRTRCLRYGPHGIHEYRGKFFPQLVKALINISGIDNGTVLDPMCGSGTTLVEAASAGHRAIGLDMNPLSVFLSRVKCQSLRLEADDIVCSFNELALELESNANEAPKLSRSTEDETYVERWFSDMVLEELDHITSTIDRLENARIADLYRVSLSNILRRVSHQKEADLRIRRECKTFSRGEVRELFLIEALRTAKAIAADVAFGINGNVGETLIHEGDARNFVSQNAIAPGTVDLVVTSPPYATALPYLDTDRLSLCYLGLLSRPEHRVRDAKMIGNREISDRIRRQQWDRYLADKELLPKEICSLIDRIERENGQGKVGFRRRNLGSLLATYFFDMRNVLVQIQQALRPGAQAYLVVGNNRTTTPAGELEVKTSELLLIMAAAVGFVDCTKVEMEMLHSRDIFRDNRTPSEHILSMRRQ